MTADLEQAARAICVHVANSHSVLLCGSPISDQKKMLARMRELRPGDLVVELTTSGMPARSMLNNIGTLIKITREKVDFGPAAEPWDEEAKGQPHPTEEVVYIRTLDGREFRWTNAWFVSLAGESPLPEMTQPVGRGER